MWQVGKYQIEPLRFMLILAVVLEVGLLTFFNKIAGSQGSPVILFIASLMVVFIPVKLLKKGVSVPSIPSPVTVTKLKLNGVYIALSVGMGAWVLGIVDHYKLDNMLSDVIPTIQFQVNQLLNGQYPYEVITTFEYPLPPTYLPMMWLPYVLPELAGLDYRIFAYLLFVICLIPYKNYLLKKDYPVAETLIKLALPFILMASVLIWKTEEIGWSVETMIMGYYVLLAVAVLTGNMWLLAIGLICCLLSRFSLAFWVPYLLIVIWGNVSFNRAFTIGAAVVLGILALYVIPFLSQDWESFSKGMEYYTFAAHTEWSGQAWQKPGDQPYQLSNGVGFATYFYNLLSGSIDGRIGVIKQWHIIMSVLAVIVWGALHYIKLRKYDYRIIALLGLKFYFIFFYSFIQVPYIYLFFVPTVISIIIISTISLEGTITSRIKS